MEATPRLIEQGVRNYMHVVLHKCYDQRVRLYSIGLNVGVLVLFLGILSLSLWYGYSKKLTPHERQQKMLRDQHTILTKIREFQAQKQVQKEQFSKLVQRVEPAIVPQSSSLNHTGDFPSEPHVDLMYSMAMGMKPTHN